jgi:sugar (pentulose or hexulose) kinase
MLFIGVDLGTSKISGVAVRADTGQMVAQSWVANDACVTSADDQRRGRSEWNADLIVARGMRCLAELSGRLSEASRQVAGIGITGQQHGVVIVEGGTALTPLINWQDRRCNDRNNRTGRSYLEEARALCDAGAELRCGCRLQPGFAAATLYWLLQNGLLPGSGTACCIMDHFAGLLTETAPQSEPSSAGGMGVFNVARRTWDDPSINALGLPRALFPQVAEANQPLGALCREVAQATGLPAGAPVFPAIGDHQASYLGSVSHRESDVLVNVGTGAQVAVFTQECAFEPPVELRPFPVAGNLQSNVGLAGGWAYRLFAQFVSAIGTNLFGGDSGDALYGALNRLAAAVPSGALGLTCAPTFAGTRANPDARGSFTGITPQNFTPAHFARALLEGMARTLAEGYGDIARSLGRARHLRLVAAGNGLRENALLAQLVAQALELPMAFTRHREEAAFGAALVAAAGTGAHADLAAAAKAMIHYQ